MRWPPIRAAGIGTLAPRDIDLRVLGKADTVASDEVLTAAIALARELKPMPVQVIVVPTVSAPVLLPMHVASVDIPTHQHIAVDIPTHDDSALGAAVALAA